MTGEANSISAEMVAALKSSIKGAVICWSPRGSIMRKYRRSLSKRAYRRWRGKWAKEWMAA